MSVSSRTTPVPQSPAAASPAPRRRAADPDRFGSALETAQPRREAELPKDGKDRSGRSWGKQRADGPEPRSTTGGQKRDEGRRNDRAAQAPDGSAESPWEAAARRPADVQPRAASAAGGNGPGNPQETFAHPGGEAADESRAESDVGLAPDPASVGAPPDLATSTPEPPAPPAEPILSIAPAPPISADPALVAAAQAHGAATPQDPFPATQAPAAAAAAGAAPSVRGLAASATGGAASGPAAEPKGPNAQAPAGEAPAEVAAAGGAIVTPIDASEDSPSGEDSGQPAAQPKPQMDFGWAQAGLPPTGRPLDVPAGQSFSPPPGPAPTAPAVIEQVSNRFATEKSSEATQVASAAETGAPGETFHALVFDAASVGSGGGRVAAPGPLDNAAPAAPADPRAAQGAAVPVSAVPIEIGMRALAGAQSFQIRLHPEEYGRVDVKLDIDDDGGVSAVITTDRVEALNLLQRDAKTLERAFEQAGLKTSENSLQFSLNGNGDGRSASDQQAGRDQQQQRRSPARQDADVPALPADMAAALRSIRTGASGLDIRI